MHQTIYLHLNSADITLDLHLPLQLGAAGCLPSLVILCIRISTVFQQEAALSDSRVNILPSPSERWDQHRFPAEIS